jgi:hypothetical protein
MVTRDRDTSDGRGHGKWHYVYWRQAGAAKIYTTTFYNCASNKTLEAWGEKFRSEVMHLALAT